MRGPAVATICRACGREADALYGVEELATCLACWEPWRSLVGDRPEPTAREEPQPLSANRVDKAPQPAPSGRPAARGAPRAASARYRLVAAAPDRLEAPDGRTQPLAAPVGDVGQLAAAARALEPEGDVIVWVHDACHGPWGLPRRPTATTPFLRSARTTRLGDKGGVRVEGAAGAVFVQFPAWGDAFRDLAGPAELLAALECYRAAVGLAFLHSGASTLRRLVAHANRALEDAEPEPPVDFSPSAYHVRAYRWSRPAPKGGVVRRYDRNASYLAAWGGQSYSRGGWVHGGQVELAGPLSEAALGAGYFLVDLRGIPRADDLPDPFARVDQADGEPVWLTTPLVRLAAELAPRITILESWVADDRVRALDGPAATLADARAALRAQPGPAPAAALDAIKGGYAALTNWFEETLKEGPLARPYWRRAILDRNAANTWRGLAKCTPRPHSLTHVDEATFALDGPDVHPEGLDLSDAIGKWKLASS